MITANSDDDDRRGLYCALDGWREDARGAHIRIHRESGVRTIDLRGSFVLGDSTCMLRQTAAVLVAAGDIHVILNLSDVSKIDSAALGAMTMLAADIQHSGGRIAAVRPTRTYIGKVLIETKLDTVIPFYASHLDAQYAVLEQKN